MGIVFDTIHANGEGIYWIVSVRQQKSGQLNLIDCDELMIMRSTCDFIDNNANKQENIVIAFE